MAFPYDKLKADSGNISGYIFENPQAGLERGLYLSIYVYFAPLRYDDGEWRCALISEFIPFNGRSWKDIEKVDSSDNKMQEIMDTSFYLTKHDSCNEVSINLTLQKNNMFRTKISTHVDFSGYLENDENPSMPVAVDLVIPFTGFTIQRDSFFPKPNNLEEAIDLASPFIDIKSFQEPTFTDGKFVFKPRNGDM